jgi:nucleoside-diphosphate-sugar epimerase
MFMPQTNWKQFHGDAFRDTRVLVTGGAGFIGSHLCEALTQLSARVVVLDDLTGGTDANLRGMPRVELVRGSILDQNLLQRAIQGCRWVFHEAALGSVPQSLRQPRLYYEVNVTGTLNVLEAARANRVQRVIYAGSSSAYGDSPVLPKIETMPPSPRSPYAASKLAGEGLMRAYSASFGLDTASLRYFNVFGPRQNANSAYAAVIAAFAKALIAGHRPTIFGDGEQSRDFTFVHNAVHANLLAARCAQPLNGEVANVGTGQRLSVNELARRMAGHLGKPELSPAHEPDRPGDVKHSLADLAQANRLIGYDPIVSFDEGLSATLNWYLSSGA